jgi:hypothetical protein
LNNSSSCDYAIAIARWRKAIWQILTLLRQIKSLCLPIS